MKPNPPKTSTPFKRGAAGFSCSSFIFVCLALSFAALFLASAVFNQRNAESLNSTATRLIGRPVLPTVIEPVVPTEVEIVETIVMSQSGKPNVNSTTDSSVDSSVDSTAEVDLNSNSTKGSPTALPLPGQLSTMGFPLTVTAQMRAARTQDAGYYGDLYATRTALADLSDSIFASLTAQAEESK